MLTLPGPVSRARKICRGLSALTHPRIPSGGGLGGEVVAAAIDPTRGRYRR